MSSSRSTGTELSRAAVRATLMLQYSVRGRPLDDALALRQARELLREPPTGCSLDAVHAGLTETIGSSVGVPFGTPSDEFRDHLRRVLAALDRMRPWTPPVLRALDDDEWAAYRAPRVVGRLLLPGLHLGNRLPYAPGLDRAPDGAVRHYVVLRLRSGRDVALAGPWWPDDEDSTAVLTLDRRVRSATVMAELTAGSHFEPGEWQILR